jgi:alpha-L-fucosidase
MTPEEIDRNADALVDDIVDRTSKNGVTLLSIGPRADGTIPEYQIEMLKKLGGWMKVNKEALYGSTPTAFSDAGVNTWKAGTIRFTTKGNYLYAIELKAAAAGEVIPGLRLKPGATVGMVGDATDLPWHQDGGNVVIDRMPDKLPCSYAWSFRIRKSDIVH